MKKRTKKLSVVLGGLQPAESKRIKVFCFFSSEKKCFLSVKCHASVWDYYRCMDDSPKAAGRRVVTADISTARWGGMVCREIMEEGKTYK